MLIETSQFESMVFRFNCELDPTTNEPFQIQFDNSRFRNFSTVSSLGLFKFAALEMINNIADFETKVDLSVKYQALSEGTAMIGVVEQEYIKEDSKEMRRLESVGFAKQAIQQDAPSNFLPPPKQSLNKRLSVKGVKGQRMNVNKKGSRGGRSNISDFAEQLDDLLFNRWEEIQLLSEDE